MSWEAKFVSSLDQEGYKLFPQCTASFISPLLLAGFINAHLILRLQQLITYINKNYMYMYDAHIQSSLHLHSLSLGCGVL